MCNRRLVGKKIARALLEHRLLFVEDERHLSPYAPGSSSRRLAMMFNCTSLVPPSIEFALVRSQERAAIAAARALAYPFERIRAAGRHQQLVAALVQLGTIIFQHRRHCGMALLRLGKIADALKRELEGGGIDVEARRSAGAQQRIGEHAVLGADSIGGDLAERTPGAQADAADHLALMRRADIWRHPSPC